MSDDSLFWTHKARSALPAEARRAGLVAPKRLRDMELRATLHGESVGWEAQILRDGDLSFARTFILRDVAVGWAKNERDRLGKDDLFL